MIYEITDLTMTTVGSCWVGMVNLKTKISTKMEMNIHTAQWAKHHTMQTNTSNHSTLALFQLGL